jgi:hypothetical protein
VYATLPKMQTDDRSAIIALGSAGSVRQYDNAEDQGSGNEDFDSYVLIPIPVSTSGGEGIIHAISAALAKDSENVNWELYAGDTAEEAYTKAEAGSSPDFTGAQWTYTSTQYWNYWQHPRIRANFAYLKLKDVSNERWLLEEIVARIQPLLSLRRVG